MWFSMSSSMLISGFSKSASIEFPLVKITPDSAYFGGLTFRKLRDGSMRVFLRIKRGSGEVVEEAFHYQPWDRWQNR